MGKKTARRRLREEFDENPKIRALFSKGQTWSPLQRDMGERSYTKNIKPCSDNQRRLIEAIEQRNLVVALGPAGTGKTYLAIAKAVEALEAGKVSRIILSRPAVEAGESLGYLPGTLEDKLAPYLRPLYDALTERLGGKRLKSLMAENIIEIAPVAYMRGRTLNGAFIVIDEAQNCTYVRGWDGSRRWSSPETPTRPTCLQVFQASDPLPTASAHSTMLPSSGSRNATSSATRWWRPC